MAIVSEGVKDFCEMHENLFHATPLEPCFENWIHDVELAIETFNQFLFDQRGVNLRPFSYIAKSRI